MLHCNISTKSNISTKIQFIKITKYKNMKKLLIFIITFFFFNITYADNSTYLLLEKNIYKENDYKKQITKIDYLLNIINSDFKVLAYLKPDLYSIKSKIVSDNFENIISNFQLNNPNFDYENNFKNLKKYELEASSSPYFLLKLKNLIIWWETNDLYIWSYVYLKNPVSQEKFLNKEYFSEFSKNLRININNYENTEILTDEDISKFENNSFYIKNNFDLDNLANYIIQNNIWFDSKIYSYYKKNKNILSNVWTKFITINSIHTKQKYWLSCESNSATYFANHFLENKISEINIIDSLPKNTSKITKIWKNYERWNPNLEFVWDIKKWVQTISKSKLTGYWVYANPISKVLNDFWIKNRVWWFNEFIIKNNILNNKPVIFWYLSNTDGWWADYNPVIWYSSWVEIKWYIWEHTWVIVWYDTDNSGDISKIYFYEWHNLEIQSMDFLEATKRASVFDMMIY